MLWPDSPPEDARHNLRQILVYVRQAVGEEIFEATRQSIELLPTVRTDLQFVLHANDSLLSPDESLKAAEEAVRYYDGVLLPGFDDEWLEPIRYQCSHIYAKALGRLSDHLIESDPAQALTYTERAIQAEPFIESLRAKKIQILLAMGEAAMAHRELGSFRKFLDQELGIEPSSLSLEQLSPEAEPSSTSPAMEEASADPIDFLLSTPRPSRGLLLACDMASYWKAAGTIDIGISTLERALAACSETAPISLMQRAQCELAGLLMMQVRHYEALDIINRVLERCTAPQVRILALSNLLRLHVFTYQAQRALPYINEALELARAYGTTEELADILRNVSDLEIVLGRPEKAEEYARQCSAQARKIGDWQLFAVSISQVAIALTRLGRLDEAKHTVQLGLKELELKSGRHVAFTRGRFSRILEELGEFELAEQGYRLAIEGARTYDDQMGLAIDLTYLGDLLHVQDRNEEAMRCHREALQIRRSIRERLGEATSLRGIGRILLAEGKLDEARETLRESSRLFLLCGAEPGHASALLELARVAQRSGQADLALRIAIRARDLLMGMPVMTRRSIGPTGDQLADDADRLVQSLQNK